MRYLGIDFGTKNIGLALSDEEGRMGFPHGSLSNTAAALDALRELVHAENVETIVIGESRTLSGGENPLAREARAFGDRLAAATGLPVRYESEVFTSAQARRAPAKEGKSRARKSRKPVDASAAALILTGYLSRPDHE